MDGAATTGLMATMAIMERGLQMPSQSLLLLLTLTLMLMPGTVTTAMATAAMDGAVTTGLMATMATGAKQANREVDSFRLQFSADISQYFQSLRLVWAAGV